MVARIGAGPADLVDEADSLRAQLQEARARDEAAFAAVVAAQALPKAGEAESAARRSALDAALTEAAEAPLHTALLALRVLNLAERAYEASSPALVSDAGCAAEFAYAAVLACAYNVRINHRYMKDRATIARQAATIAGYEVDASATLSRLRQQLFAALGSARER